MLGPRQRLSLPSLLLAASLAALTCDDSRRDDPLAERIARAFCAHRFACCSPLELAAMTSDRYRTEADCVDFATLAARQQLGTVEGAIAQGRITIDEPRASACLQALSDRACGADILVQQNFGQLSPLPNVAEILASCPEMLVGHVGDNLACNLSRECLRGSRCVSGTPTVIPGNPFPGAGGTGGTVTTMPGVCVPYQQAGERCNQTTDCDPRLSCHAPEFTCGPRPKQGEPCVFELDMMTGYPISTCDDRLFCDPTFGNSICRRYPRDTEPCNQVSAPQCDPDPALGLTCNSFSGTCRRPGGDGDACGAPAIPPCREELACHPMQSDGIGVCGPIPGLGEPCVDRCVTPAICVGNRCMPPGLARIGEPCTNSTDCATLACTGFQAGHQVCGPPLYFAPRCVGVGITPGNVGNPGIGGTFGTGIAGTFGTGFAGTFGAGGRGATTGTGGAAGGAFGCPFSEVAPTDPIIADFDLAMGEAPILPIGGTFTFGSPSPTATAVDGAWHVTLKAAGTDTDQFLGAGIFFNADPSGIACIDAGFHTGVQFDISGRIEGAGCSAQYATNDSNHTEARFDPKGSGPPGAFSPQASLKVTATPTTVRMPFFGPGAPLGGNPAIGIDPSRLTSVQWQFTLAAGVASTCIVDVTIDNVRFF